MDMPATEELLVAEGVKESVPPLNEKLKLVPESGVTAYVARHAEPFDYTSSLRVTKVYGNHGRQVWLTQKGIEQAYAGRDFFCTDLGRMGLVVHSPLWRAFQTAHILMDYHYVGGPDFIPDRRLDDIRLGPWLDIPRRDWTDHRMLYWQEQLKSPGLARGGPENPYQTQQRVVESFFEHIQKHANGLPILLVFHGDPICFLLQYLQEQELMNLVGYRLEDKNGKHKIDKCTIVRIVLEPGKVTEIELVFKP